MRAALDGEFARAEALASEALAAGERVQSHVSMPVYLGQVFGIRWLQGRLGELTDMISALIEGGSNVPALHCGLAQCAAQARRARPRPARARAPLCGALRRPAARRVPPVHAREPRAAWSAVSARSITRARSTEELLPYAGLTVVVGPGLGYFGAVAHHLGVLAATAGRFADAERHFIAALELDSRMGARAWIACTQCELATMLLRRGRAGGRRARGRPAQRRVADGRGARHAAARGAAACARRATAGADGTAASRPHWRAD